MRKYIVILVCLWVTVAMYAVSYSTYRPTGGTSFRSTSAYVATQHTSLTINMSSPRPTAMGLTAISASNFNTLNEEGGACYLPSATSGGPRRVKIDEPETESVGEGVWESPIGDIPWIFFMLLLFSYLLRHSLPKKRESKFA